MSTLATVATTDDGLEFAAWLGSAIEQAGIRKRDLSRRLAAEWGIGDETVRRSLYKWLEGKHAPSRQRRVTIGRVLGVPYPETADQSLAGRLGSLETALLELLQDGAVFRREVIARLERLEQRFGNEERPSTARTAQ